jgi:hypothetical protein
MIEGRTILCFASGYDAPPTSKHHVMHLLAKKADRTSLHRVGSDWATPMLFRGAVAW